MKGLLLACLCLPLRASAGSFAALTELVAPGETPSEGAGRFVRPAAVLIHGLRGSVEEMSAIAARVGRRHQVYALDYPDWDVDPSANGRALAARLAELRAVSGDGKPLLIVTHSLGGIVARAALNEMTASGELSRWGAVRVVCVDAPWHGIPSWKMPLPGALNELRARGPLLREGFLLERVGENASIELVFASEGIAALDYTQGALDALPAKLARYYAAGEPVSGSPRLMNFWHALLTSSQYPAFQGELRGKAASGGLDAAAVSAALSAHFPRFPGGHTGVLSSPALLDYIEP